MWFSIFISNQLGLKHVKHKKISILGSIHDRQTDHIFGTVCLPPYFDQF